MKPMEKMIGRPEELRTEFDLKPKSTLKVEEARKVLEDPNSDCNKNSVENSDIAKRFIARTEQSLEKTEELFNRAIDARNAMDEMCDRWKASWVEFQETSDQRLKDLRMTRMAMESEIRQMMAGFREVRQFFLDKDYQEERVRLKEFVELCERLKALKESGFLDTVSDTMLNLSIGGSK